MFKKLKVIFTHIHTRDLDNVIQSHNNIAIYNAPLKILQVSYETLFFFSSEIRIVQSCICSINYIPVNKMLLFSLF